MTTMTLTKTRLIDGAWEGLLTGPGTDGPAPLLRVTHHESLLPGVAVEAAPAEGGWRVRVPIPPETIADGMQTYLIAAADSGAVLASFAVLAGDALAEDLRAEVDLLREELDLLKRAFRRHCVETTSPAVPG